MTKRRKILLIAAIVVVATSGTVAGVLLHRDTGERDLAPDTTPGVIGTTLPTARLNNMVQGVEVQWQLPVLNTLGAATNISVEYQLPNKLAEGFVIAPDDARQWVSITPSAFELDNNKARIVTVILKIPYGVSVPAQWEFWIGIFPNDGGNLQAGVASRCLVTMKA
jgi:hypothetical protein